MPEPGFNEGGQSKSSIDILMKAGGPSNLVGMEPQKVSPFEPMKMENKPNTTVPPFPILGTAFGPERKRYEEQLEAGNIPKSVQIMRSIENMAGSKGLTAEELALQDAERHIYERAIEAMVERITSTTFAPEIRMATRDFEFSFVDAPPGLGDNYHMQMAYNAMDNRRDSLIKARMSDASKRALGFNLEPWREASMIPQSNINELTTRIFYENPKITNSEVQKIIGKMVDNAEKRIPSLCDELARSRRELANTRKIFINTWNIRNLASGQELGSFYAEGKMPMIPRDEFAEMFAEPPYFMSQEEGKGIPGFPSAEEVKSFLTEAERATEGETLGAMVERESRLILLVSLSENPEEVVKWMDKTETEQLHSYFRSKGINAAYLTLKEKGINYRDSNEENKIKRILGSLTAEQRQGLKDVWWKRLGYKGEKDGIEKIGDPRLWIHMKARRGEVPADVSGFLPNGFDREARVKLINQKLLELKKCYDNLSPLNNLPPNEQDIWRNKIELIMNGKDGIRELQVIRAVDDENKPITVNLFNTLSLERELKVRKGPAELGCVWSVPQTFGEKKRLMDEVLGESVKGDPLAYEKAKAFTELCGFQAKHGFYAVDFDPATKKWGVVAVEGWPYTSELQTVLAWPWYQLYKQEAGGPEGSRGKFGPPMTDFLSACITQEKDEKGNDLFIIVDTDGKIRKGRTDEGLVLANTQSNLMDIWQKGISLKDPNLWNRIVIEDPYRRWLLRSFFGEGKAVLGPNGDPIMDLWKKQDWKLEDLDNNKIWDNYKLARKVTLRDELFDEAVWRDVVAPINKKYNDQITSVLNAIQGTKNSAEIKRLMVQYKSAYKEWMKQRKKVVYDYSDMMFGNGLLSTEMFNQAHLQQVTAEKHSLGDPKIVMARILERAKSRDIHLGWNVKSETNLISQIKKEWIKK